MVGHDPILTADDFIRSGACANGVYRVIRHYGGNLPGALPLSAILRVIRPDQRIYAFRAAEMDGYGCGDGYGTGEPGGDGNGTGSGTGVGYGVAYGQGAVSGTGEGGFSFGSGTGFYGIAYGGGTGDGCSEGGYGTAYGGGDGCSGYGGGEG